MDRATHDQHTYQTLCAARTYPKEEVDVLYGKGVLNLRLSESGSSSHRHIGSGHPKLKLRLAWLHVLQAQTPREPNTPL